MNAADLEHGDIVEFARTEMAFEVEQADSETVTFQRGDEVETELVQEDLDDEILRVTKVSA